MRINNMAQDITILDIKFNNKALELNEIFEDIELQAQFYEKFCSKNDKGNYVLDVSKQKEVLKEIEKKKQEIEDRVKIEKQKALEENKEYDEEYYKEKYFDEYTEQNPVISMANGENASPYLPNQLQVYNKVKSNYPEKMDEFKSMISLMDNLESKEVEQTALGFSEDNELLLKIKNLENTGLNFAIKSDKSIVFTKDQQLTEAQVKALADFFHEQNISIPSFEPVKDIKIVDQDNPNQETGNFSETFKHYQNLALVRDFDVLTLEELDKLQHQAKEEDNEELLKFISLEITKRTQEQEEKAADPNTDYARNGTTTPIRNGVSVPETPPAPSNDFPFSKYLDIQNQGNDKSPIDVARNTFTFRLKNQMGYERKCLRYVRKADGSLVISIYGSEKDKINDGTIDKKTGVIQTTKKAAFRIYDCKPPKIDAYVPTGGKWENGYAKAMLKTIKALGYDYFTVDSEIANAGQGAIEKAAADQLMVPRLKRYKDDPNGMMWKAENWREYFNLLEDEKAPLDATKDKIMQCKMRALAEIRAQLSWSKNDSLKDIADQVEGDIKFQYWSSHILPNLNNKIINGASTHNWNAIDQACAYKALAKIAEAIDKGVFEYKDEQGRTHRVPYDYMNYSKNNVQAAMNDAINKMFDYEMRKPETRNEVTKTFKKLCINGGDTSQLNDEEEEDINTEEQDFDKLTQTSFNIASKSLVTNYKDLTNEAIAQINQAYDSRKISNGKIADITRNVRNISKGPENNVFINARPNTPNYFRTTSTERSR